jgi:formiminotetrahydrofolate cyclodeaminase
MGTLTDLTVDGFAGAVASDAPAPGGGSAAALAGAVAAGLVAMVCRLSIGRDDIAATSEELSRTLERCEVLRLRFVELVDEDTSAFDAVMDAIRMPKADDAQRAARSAALAQATLNAAAVPLETLTAARETLDLAAPLAGRSNSGAASDLGVGVHLAHTAAEGALLNVAINLASLPASADADRLSRESRAAIAAARASATATSEVIAAGLGLA